ILAGWPAGWRQPSFLGHHDLAGLSGAVGSVALLWLALPGIRSARLGLVAAVSGGGGPILSRAHPRAVGFWLRAGGARRFRPWAEPRVAAQARRDRVPPARRRRRARPPAERRRRASAPLLRDRAEGEAAERRDPGAAHAAALHRLADLPEPSGDRRRLRE